MKISVIVPVYNAARYLPVCLESLAIQTFDDFEVIVVDDCSTDNSAAIAESFLPRFDGRLRIVMLPENTGGAAVPRNVGVDLARGEYIFFLDADDFLIDTALEELFNAAESYRVQVVYIERGYLCGEEPVPYEMTEVSWNPPQFVFTEPTLETDDMAERITRLAHRATAPRTCTKFLRRDFLIDNDIKFPKMNPAEDVVWTIKILCLAKKILRLPAALYVYRMNDDSVTRKKRTPEQILNLWTRSLVIGTKEIADFMDGIEFLRTHPTHRLTLLNFFADITFHYMTDTLKALAPEEVYEIFRRVLKDSGNGALIAYLLTMNNLYRNELTK